MWKYVLDGKIGKCKKLTSLYTAEQGQHDFLNHENFGPSLFFVFSWQTHLGQNGENPSWWTKRPRTSKSSNSWQMDVQMDVQ